MFLHLIIVAGSLLLAHNAGHSTSIVLTSKVFHIVSE